MANGFLSRFKGKIMCSQLWLAAGAVVYDAVSGLAGLMDFVTKTSLTVTAATTTDFGPLSIPAGKTLMRAAVYTSTAFGAVTDAKISIGISAGDQSYVAQTTIKAVGVYNLTLVNAAAASLASMPAAPNLYVRITQSGGNSATGAATLVLEYA
jgi:hypothetical protein